MDSGSIAQLLGRNMSLRECGILSVQNFTLPKPRMAHAFCHHPSLPGRGGATAIVMAGKILDELVKKRTVRGDPYFVGTTDVGGRRTRLAMFFVECRADDRGNPL